MMTPPNLDLNRNSKIVMENVQTPKYDVFKNESLTDKNRDKKSFILPPV